MDKEGLKTQIALVDGGMPGASDPLFTVRSSPLSPVRPPPLSKKHLFFFTAHTFSTIFLSYAILLVFDLLNVHISSISTLFLHYVFMILILFDLLNVHRASQAIPNSPMHGAPSGSTTRAKTTLGREAKHSETLERSCGRLKTGGARPIKVVRSAGPSCSIRTLFV